MFRVLFFLFLVLFVSCDSSRIYETNYDLKDAQWFSSDTLSFTVPVPDSSARYNVILNVRNTIDFETSRLFVQYQLSDSAQVLRKRLIEQNLFDRKTGEPFGESGLGNVYSHQIVLEPGISFPNRGNFLIQLNHMMRTDTLEEIRSVGIRLERTQ